MRLAIAFALSLSLAGAPIAAECTLTNARYIQPHSPWVLTFKRMPKYGASATQMAAFELQLPNSDVTLNGSVNGSMGFGSPLWAIEGKCSPESEERCTFLMENQSPAIYGIYDGEVTFFETEKGVPEQIILPQLAVSLWYSNYRETEWDGDSVSPGDAFVLEGCD